MFSKSQKPYTDLLGKTNRIVEGTTIGNFQSSGKIVIGPAGSVKGDIICNNADIEGKFEGKIQVAELLNLKSNASVRGEVICSKLSVEPGADFSATCVMNPIE